ncbi:apolipoprotein D and lipocalin family protein [Salinihabitans flavidus]|uniref:Outer membrane lipoprotein Blc n=1 Tax=Salinihabitans flavidus TaxID=569882 RepID=A0A1H8TQA7_9RHOB|nr:lipocalin family protein [Salinihabitans flavidus]SEO93006.1 apolipoprotein D and lipocalin family protein [Salinihabitans flavidus]
MGRGGRLAALAGAVLSLAGGAVGAESYRDTSVPMTVDDSLQIEPYLGRWYEIARFPVWFEEGCVGVTADYSARPDGRIDVLNTCREGALDGPVETASGVARVVAPGKLQVTFLPRFSWLPFLWGDYWVLDVTDDYTVAVIGAPDGGTGWILARSPQIPDEDFEAAADVLRRNGYDTARLFRVPQDKD